MRAGAERRQPCSAQDGHACHRPLLFAIAAAAAAQGAVTDLDRREAFRQYQQGQEFLSRERWDDTADTFRAAVSYDPLFTDAHYGLGRAHTGQQRFSSAIRAYEDCIEAKRSIFGMRDKDRVGADQRVIDQVRALREALITVRRQRTGQVENQVLQIESRIRELERSRTGLTGVFEPPPQVLLALGSDHFRNGNTREAIARWEASVHGNETLGEGWNNLAVAYLREGRATDASRAVTKAEAAGFRVNPRLKQEIAAITP